jgi:N-acetylglucosaminyl-diphospho-decaprenol L-rhamnosyltransferase
VLDLSVIVLNYNGGALAGDVLRAALAFNGVRMGVVVVDNASTDDSLHGMRQVAASLPEKTREHPVVFLRSSENLGYPGGNNLGLFALHARYILLLNSDAIVTPDTFAQLVAFMDARPRAGACGPRLNWPDGTAQPFSYGGDPTPLYLLRRALAQRPGRFLHDWAGTSPREVDWVAGTCLCLRAAALAEVGMLDERIFMYFEDNDICARLRYRGWPTYFVPAASLVHHNKPTKADRPRRERYYRGLSQFYTRHYGPLAGLAIRVATRGRLLASRQGRSA